MTAAPPPQHITFDCMKRPASSGEAETAFEAGKQAAAAALKTAWKAWRDSGHI
jgi:hypothetical protein